MFPPQRIVCLTEETVETLYRLGEERRILEKGSIRHSGLAAELRTDQAMRDRLLSL